jgi:phage repressor protein C with HTH and peptisase S24 domain
VEMPKVEAPTCPLGFAILCSTDPHAEDYYVITIDGDSMVPLPSSGDRILIDTSQRAPVPPGIFVIWEGMGIVAKRIEHVPHSDLPNIVVKSLNPECQTFLNGTPRKSTLPAALHGQRSDCEAI